MESFSVSSYCPEMWGILWSFWFGMLETFKRFCHIFWNQYININFFIIPINFQSEIITTLPVGRYCLVLSEIVDNMIRIIFTKTNYAKIVHT